MLSARVDTPDKLIVQDITSLQGSTNKTAKHILSGTYNLFLLLFVGIFWIFWNSSENVALCGFSFGLDGVKWPEILKKYWTVNYRIILFRIIRRFCSTTWRRSPVIKRNITCSKYRSLNNLQLTLNSLYTLTFWNPIFNDLKESFLEWMIFLVLCKKKNIATKSSKTPALPVHNTGSTEKSSEVHLPY